MVIIWLEFDGAGVECLVYNKKKVSQDACTPSKIRLGDEHIILDNDVFYFRQ